LAMTPNCSLNQSMARLNLSNGPTFTPPPDGYTAARSVPHPVFQSPVCAELSHLSPKRTGAVNRNFGERWAALD
jgi:hypothetical protein